MAAASARGLEARAEVDALLEKCRKGQLRDPRVEIKEYDDLVFEATTTRAFDVRYLLPIWFDVQTIETAAGSEPDRRWHFD